MDLRFIDRGVNLVRSTRVVWAALGALGMTSRAGGLVRLIGRAWVVFNTAKRIKRALR